MLQVDTEIAARDKVLVTIVDDNASCHPDHGSPDRSVDVDLVLPLKFGPHASELMWRTKIRSQQDAIRRGDIPGLRCSTLA